MRPQYSNIPLIYAPNALVFNFVFWSFGICFEFRYPDFEFIVRYLWNALVVGIKT